VQVRGDGTFAQLATASVEADGSFEVRDVPAGRSDLAVVAYAGGQVVGGVLIHETTRSGAVIVTAPINHETSVEAGAYSQVRAEGSSGSASELALLVHVQGTSAEMLASSTAEIDAVADGYLAASSAMTSVYATAGTSFGSSARAQALTGAAIQFAADRHSGMSLSTAHDAFTDAALSAYASAGATLEQSVIAWGAAASAFPCTVTARRGSTSSRKRCA
jgi:hypothetical protein